MTKAASIDQWIRGNAWAILAAAFALYGGYVTGQTTTETRLDVLERDVSRIDRAVERIDQKLDGARLDPFTGRDGQELENRLRSEINRRHP